MKLIGTRRALSKKERRSYIEAIYCLQGKPSLFDEKIVPAATRLFDDFTVLHINQTHLIHNNVSPYSPCLSLKLLQLAEGEVVHFSGLAPVLHAHTRKAVKGEMWIQGAISV